MVTNQGLFSAQVCSHEVNYAYISGAVQSVVCRQEVTSIPLVVPMYVTACLYVTACPIIYFKPNSKASSHCKHERALFHG